MGGSISDNRQTHLEISQGGVLSVILFQMAINSILGKLNTGVDRSLFADDLAIYIITKNHRVHLSTAGNDQQVGFMGSREGTDLISKNNSTHDI